MPARSVLGEMRFQILFTVFLLGCSHSAPKPQLPPETPAEPCTITTQAAVDIGSGATKMLIADVSSCGPTIKKVRWQKTEKVDYQESVEKTRKHQIGPQTEAKGLKALKLMTAQKAEYNYVKPMGVATAAFRKAGNGKKVLAHLSDATAMPLKIISQKTEALMGFEVARRQIGASPDGLLVWDIGGGSQQMTWMGKKDLNSVMGQTASVTFKDTILNTIKPNGHELHSPNPMSKLEVEHAIEAAQREARHLPPKLIARLRKGDFRVVGIGGVHAKSILPQITTENGAYTQYDLEIAIEKQRKLEDKDLGDYADTQVTNMILVLGFMKELGIKQIDVVDADLTRAILLYPALITQAL
jgi:exopolyphosphatase / guanosine-5'-triphosphate,3'-diphosphate pyrophosphatase